MTSLLLRTMGCVCSRESVSVGDRRFYVQSRLGEGGFSYVDLVEEAKTHRQFALKRIACHSKEDENDAVTEVEVMRSLHHSNLCPLEISGVVAVNNRRTNITSEVLIVMPFCRRGTLQDYIEVMVKAGEHMAEDRLLRIFTGICQGLQHMHHHKPPYAHRDMKPANVLLTDNNEPLIMDFGSAAPAVANVRTTSEARKLQDFAAEKCSMPFRPPEFYQVEPGVPIDARSDIWSLGCTLYAMVYLESPFEAVYNRGDSMALAVLANINYPITSRYSAGLVEMMKTMLVPLPRRPDITQVLHNTSQLLDSLHNKI